MDDAHLSALDRLSELIDGDQPVDPAELDGIPIEEAARQLLAAAAARHLLGGGAAPGDLVGPAVRAGIAA
ncbi:MAG: hypothetical protein KDC87_08475, partial [Planctomycetes bacterium]|nr:hypothetical protein [Planctomycetota bacterium]